MDEREKKIREKYAWHSKGGPCKCDGCYLTTTIDQLRAERDEIREACTNIINQAEWGGWLNECSVPCNVFITFKRDETLESKMRVHDLRKLDRLIGKEKV